jgi:hypothetical protein
MNPCQLNKFIDDLEEFNSDRDDKILIDCYRFDPNNEKATIFKGNKNAVIDLTLSNTEQLSLFQLFLGGLNNG